MNKIQDPVKEGLERGWQVFGGPYADAPERIDCDVAIVGTGAGAGVAAELLTRAGLRVTLIEEGPLRSSTHFHQLEAQAYQDLYQESAARKTRDKSINILQGRCVGGSTTVNWTSSFRTPTDTLAYWADRLGLRHCTPEALAPYFEQAERRLGIGPWMAPPNENNELLRRGAKALGMESDTIARNVKGCWNLGSCGMGCPTNAKQSMLVTTIPWALDHGARLLVETHAERLDISNQNVCGLLCSSRPLGAPVSAPRRTRVVAAHYLIAGGAINSPALLLRSQAPDPFGTLGTRTFLHPVVLSVATYTQRVEAWAGAPQTIYSDHFLHSAPIDGEMGFKLEAPPLHPLIFASTLSGFGMAHFERVKSFPHTHVLLALMRDGFHPESAGGCVTVRRDGSPELDYPLTKFVLDGARKAMLTMAEIQFAAGAQTVLPGHEMASECADWSAAKIMISQLPMVPLKTKVVSAHVMGGCAMSEHERQGVVRPDGRHWQLRNLSIMDGSIFPTSIGANPQLSIYGLVNRMAQGLAKHLARRDVQLA